jgi:hypothetical protein
MLLRALYWDVPRNEWNRLMRGTLDLVSCRSASRIKRLRVSRNENISNNYSGRMREEQVQADPRIRCLQRPGGEKKET